MTARRFRPVVESLAISRPLFEAMAEALINYTGDFPCEVSLTALCSREFRSHLPPSLLRMLEPDLREVGDLDPEDIQATAYILSLAKKARAQHQREQRAQWKRMAAERVADEQRAGARAAARAAAKATASSVSIRPGGEVTP